MAVRIRLMRTGKIRNPQYRVVIADSRKKRDGRAIEQIGLYYPKQDPSFIQINSERAQHWLSVGAQPSQPVQRLLELTGDWQKFKGLPAPEPMKTAAPKADKHALYEAEAKATLAAAEETKAAKAEKKKPAKKAAKADKPEAKADKPEAKAEKADAKADKPEAKADKPEAKAEKADAKAEKKADAKAEKSDAKPEKAAKADAKADKADATSEGQAGADAGAES